MNILENAKILINSGVSFLPIRANGTKAPAIAEWTSYQERIPTEDEVSTWFQNEKVGIALIGGKVSRNLECIDFDEPGLFEKYKERGQEWGLSDLIEELVLQETPREGRHLISRCESEVQGSQKLAWKETDEIDEKGNKKRKVLIETKGEKGYFLIEPSPPECHPQNKPYRILKGSLKQIPVITKKERESLLDLACSFNELVTLVKPPPPKKEQTAETFNGLLPGTDFNQRGDFEALLMGEGWDKVKGNYWRRSGKEGRGWSATLNKVAPGVFYVFSSNASPFEPGHGYDLFTAYTLLKHNGNFHESAKALYQQGYGDRIQKAMKKDNRMKNEEKEIDLKKQIETMKSELLNANGDEIYRQLLKKETIEVLSHVDAREKSEFYDTLQKKFTSKVLTQTKIKEIEKAVKEKQKNNDGERNNTEKFGEICILNDQYCKLIKGVPLPISNFIMNITKDIYLDNEIEQTRLLSGEIKIAGEKTSHPFFDENSKEFTNTQKLKDLLGRIGGTKINYTCKPDDIRNISFQLSNPERKDAFMGFGFTKDNSTYYSPSVIITKNCISPNDQLVIDMSSEEGAKFLDLSIISDEEFKKVGEHIRDELTNLHDRFVIDTLIAHTFISPLTSALTRNKQFHDTRCGLWLLGTTGYSKSYTAIKFQNFFGNFHANHSVMGWTSSPYSIQKVGYYFNDALYLVDDFKKSFFDGNKYKYSTMIEVLQNYGDSRGRNRLNPDISMNKKYYIRGNMLITGEDLPTHEASILGRYLIIDIPQWEITEKLKDLGRKCEKMQYLYKGFMGRFIHHVISQEGWESSIIDLLDTNETEFLKGIGGETNGIRVAKHLAFNFTGYTLYIDFLKDAKLIGDGKAQEMLVTHKQQLLNYRTKQLKLINENKASTVFLSALRDLISCGRCEIDNENRNSENELKNMIGFEKNGDPNIYIIASVAHRDVHKFLVESGAPLNFSQNAISKQLVIDGIVQPEGEEKRPTKNIWFNGKGHRVYAISKKNLYGSDEKNDQ